MRRCFEDRLNDLKVLPALEPPAHLEAATLEAMAKASAPGRARPLALAAGWSAVIGIGALLSVLVMSLEDPGDMGPSSPAREGRPPSAAAEEQRGSPEDEEAYLALLEQSEYLEQLLAGLPQRQVMRVSTAGTIVGLEERIALIDSVLSREEAKRLSPAYRVALMRDRVDTMSALVTLRYAQSPAFAY